MSTPDTITHYINGAAVDTDSGRYADVYNPALGEPVARVALGTVAEVDAAGHAAADARAGAVPLPATVPAVHRRIRDHAHARTRQDLRRRAGRSRARHRDDRIRGRHSAVAERRIHRPDFARHRRVVDAPGTWRRRRHHAVQLPGDGADVDVPGRYRLRQYLHPEAVRTRSVAVAAARAPVEGSRSAGRRVQRHPG